VKLVVINKAFIATLLQHLVSPVLISSDIDGVDSGKLSAVVVGDGNTGT